MRCDVVRVIHTADLQLGKAFHFVEGDPGARLRQARIEVLKRIGELAADPERPADVVLIAGDLFDSNTVEDRVVLLTCEALAAFPCPVLIIPGNHDHGGADSVFHRRRWAQSCPDGVEVALDSAPRVFAGGRLVVLPAPLLRRHDSAPVTAAMRAEQGQEHPDAVRIGLAHGSVHGFTSDASFHNEVEVEVIERADLDYLALGDWHGAKQISPRIWYSGTPEPDRFKENDPGHVLRVEIDAHGALPRVEPVPVAQIQWLRHHAELNSRAEVIALRGWLSQCAPESLVRLELAGVLSFTDLAELDEVLDHAGARLLHLRLRGPGVVAAPRPEELSTIATEGYVHAAVQKLLALADSDTEQGALATEALRLLHQLHVEKGAENAGT